MKMTILAILAAMFAFTLTALAAPKPEVVSPTISNGSVVSWVLAQPSTAPHRSFRVIFKGDCSLDTTLVLPARSIDVLEQRTNCRITGANCGVLECDSVSDLVPLLSPLMPGLNIEIQPREWDADTFGRSVGFHWRDGSSFFIATNEPLPRSESGELLDPDPDDPWWQQYIPLADNDCIWHTGIGIVGTGPGGRPDSCGCGAGFCTCGWLECFIEVNGSVLGGSLRRIGGLGGP